MINEEIGNLKNISPILSRNISMGHKEKAGFNNIIMFMFNKTILFMGRRTIQSVKNTYRLKTSIETTICPTLISLNHIYF